MILLSSLVDTANENVRAKGGDDGDDEEPDTSAVLIHLLNLLLVILFRLE